MYEPGRPLHSLPISFELDALTLREKYHFEVVNLDHVSNPFSFHGSCILCTLSYLSAKIIASDDLLLSFERRTVEVPSTNYLG